MIVTIDGPAGAGKSTSARELAQRLSFQFLDTGAMYRAVTWYCLKQKIDLENEPAVAAAARRAAFEFKGGQVFVDEVEVTREIRRSAVTDQTKFIAGNNLVRKQLVELQRKLAAGTDVVTEGRDQGTVVFPAAECKIFLTASPEERARRRLLDLQSQGEMATFEQILADQHRRDAEDAAREVGPLRRADDAIEVLTDGLTQEQVVDRLEALVRSRTR